MLRDYKFIVFWLFEGSHWKKLVAVVTVVAVAVVAVAVVAVVVDYVDGLQSNNILWYPPSNRGEKGGAE